MPISVLATAVLSLVPWKDVFKKLATDTATSQAKSLIGRLKSDEREKTSKHVVELFVQEFVGELEDKAPLSAAIDGYRDQLKKLIENAAPEITACLQPDTKDVDLGPVERMWQGLRLDPLPEDFDWKLVAANFARDLRAYVKHTPELRQMLTVALQEKQTDLLARIAGPDPGFNLAGYREFVRKKCGVLALSAMHTSAYDRRITLWSVFVPQSVRQSVPVRDIPRELRRRLREEKHLTADQDEHKMERMRQVHQESSPIPVLQALDRERLAVVLGDPGSGKTSLLKYLVIRWLETGADNVFPIWIDLKEYVRERKGILQYLESACVTFHMDAQALDAKLKSGQAAIYLDGLDEIFDGPTRGSVIEEIAAFSALYRESRIVVTSRILGYEADRLRNAGFAHLTLEEFDDAQVNDFVEKWHEAAEEDPKERARLKSQLEAALKESKAVRELAGNPLLLTMTAILNRTQPLPRNRVELYEQASRVLLYEWDASRSLPVDTFARQEKEALLRELAGAMQTSKDGNLIDYDSLIVLFRKFLTERGVPDPPAKAESLAKQLIERNFILCYAGANRFSFVHRTFLEYFSAAWFVELFEKKQSLTLEQLKLDVFGRHWKDETWHEVLRLIVGMVGEKKAEQLIRFLMEQDGRYDKLTNLALAAECLGEVRNRQAIHQTDEALQNEVIGRGVRYAPPYYYDPRDLFKECGETRFRFVGLLNKIWHDHATWKWLRSAIESDADWIVRMSVVQELAWGWKDDPETLPCLKERIRADGDDDVRTIAVQELAQGWKDDPETLPILQKRAGTDENFAVRKAAVQELARGWAQDSETLEIVKERARADEVNDVRKAAVQELARHWQHNPETLPWLKERARSDPNEFVRLTAVQELARGWAQDPETQGILKERARSDENWAVRQAAVQEWARGWPQDPETLPWLKERARSDPDEFVRSTAVQELARGWAQDPETLVIIKERARCDKEWLARRVSMQELARGWAQDPDTLVIIKERACSDVNWAVRRTAVQELARGWQQDPETLAIVKELARSDDDSDVRQRALQEWVRGWMQDPETLPWLKEHARSDEEIAVRQVALRELARGWAHDPKTLEIVKGLARSDESKYVRQVAVQELARGWQQDPDTLPWLKERALADESEYVRQVAVQELVRGWKDHPDVRSLLLQLEATSDATS